MFMLQENSNRRWNPFEELERFQREMSRIFGGPSGGYAGVSSCPANLWVNEEDGVLAIDAPGVNPEDIEVSVVDSTVTVQFKRMETELDKSESYVRRERRSGEYSRTFELPYAIDAGKVEARYDNGVIQIKLPCAEAEKPTKIAVAVR